MLVAQLRFQVSGKRGISPQLVKAGKRCANGLQFLKLFVEFGEIAFVAQKGAITRCDVADIQLVSRQDELSGELVEALEECERHRHRQERSQDVSVEVKMRRLSHVTQVRLDAFRVNVAVMAFSQRPEGGVIQRPLFSIQKITALERRGNIERRHLSVGLSCAGEFHPQSPCLHLFTVRPSELQPHI